MTGAMRHKTLAVAIKSAGEPTAEQMAAIRTYTLADVPAEKLYVRTFALAHNAIDRDNEAFDEGLLADFARTLPGKGLFIKHPTGWDGDSGPGKGRWFAARAERMSLDEARETLRAPDLQWPPGTQTAVLLMADAYLVRTNGNADLLEEIDAGVVSDVSIGFRSGSRAAITDDDGRELTSTRLLGPGEALEGSLVWLGAQPGARAIKGAPRNSDPEDTAVEVTKEQYEAAKTAQANAEEKAANLQRELDTARPAADQLKALRTALGDAAHLVDKPEQLAEAVKAAGEHRESLVDEIVAAERALGLCGDDDEAVDAAKAIYAGESLGRLKTLAAHYAARAPKGSRMPPSDPCAGRETGGKDSFADNPAFGGGAATA